MGDRVVTVLLFTAAPGPGQPDAGAFVKIDGRESLLRSVELFASRPGIARSVVIFTPERDEECRTRYGSHLMFAGVKAATGGPTVVDQLVAGAAKLADGTTHVLIHDAARPAVVSDEIDAMLELSEKHDRIAMSTSVDAPVVTVDEGGDPQLLTAANEARLLLHPQLLSAAAFRDIVESKSLPDVRGFHLFEAHPTNRRANSGRDAGLLKSMLGLMPKPKVSKATNPFEEAQW